MTIVNEPKNNEWLVLYSAINFSVRIKYSIKLTFAGKQTYF